MGILSIKLRSYGAPEISGFLEFFKSYRGYLFITYPTAFYIIKFIFPLPLSFIYPHVSYYFYNNLMLPVLVWSSPFILLAVLIIIWKAKNMRRPLIFTGLFYFSTIFSTLQIIPVVSISAHDRYFYVPILGFVFFVAWLYVYFKQKNRSKAIMFYFTAILAFSLSFAVISFNRTKIWKSTITLFEDVIKKQPRFIEGYDKLAEHYEIIQDHRNAITWSKQVIKKRDNHPGTYVRLLKMHMALNELDSAMMYAPYAVNNATTEQQLVEVYSIKGYLDMIYKRYTDAIADYDIILRYDPNSAHSFAQRATAKMSLRQYEPALSDFARYLQLQPGDAEVYVNMARIYIDTNRSTLAIESLNNALQLNPEHPDAYLMRGYTLLQTGQRAAACADFNRAKDLGNTTALEWIQNYCR
jgi:tetratricopeptide (TPR) repeat protein